MFWQQHHKTIPVNWVFWGFISLLICSCAAKSDHTILRNDTSETLFIEVVPPDQRFDLLFDKLSYLGADSLLIERQVVFWPNGIAYADKQLDTLRKLDYPGVDTAIILVGAPRPLGVQLLSDWPADSLLVFALSPGGDFSIGGGPHRWIRWGPQVPVFWKEIRLFDQEGRELWVYSKRNLRRLFRTRTVSTFRSGGTVSIYHYVFHWLPKR